jgi:Xaa-Pro aminopeptidase
MDHASRLDSLAARLERPLLVTDLANIRYLTGFGGSSAYLLVKPDEGSVFATDGRYGEMAEPLVGALRDTELVVYTSGLWDVLRGMLEGIETLSLESEDVTWDFVRTLAAETGAGHEPTTGIVADLRRTKDAGEIAALRSAASCGDAAFARLRGLLGEATTEAELGWALVDEMRRAGGDAAEWEPIVAAGTAASIPHYRSGAAPVGDGLLLLDYGCTVDGYHSDMSRTVWIDGEADEQLVRVHRAVAESQLAGIEAIAAGVTCGDVDEAARAVLRGYGYEEHFLHSTGHGVGLEIHERPWVRKGNDDPLRVGDVVTVEPGVYLPGVGGVRIEDMVAVTEAGPELLTESPRGMALA